MRLTSPVGLGVRALLSAGVTGAVLLASAVVVAVSGAALLLAVPVLVAPDGWLERGLLWGVAVSAVLVFPAFTVVTGYSVRYERRLLLEGTAPVTAIDAEETRALDDDATRFATQFGVPKPQVRLHPAPAPFAYTTYRPSDPLVGVRRTGSPVVVVSKGLVRTLPRDETAAVLAHEFAHLANDDLRLTSWLLVPLVAAEFLHDGGEAPTGRREPLEDGGDRRPVQRAPIDASVPRDPARGAAVARERPLRRVRRTGRAEGGIVASRHGPNNNA